ncbi:LADA_0A01134g1_1 [Lachancea dasiensis]|uniref:LADA_0A01134g1_1 n=1 Tax=Lachancea dasiensis TaxID=1072105 RepID=A0A1G4IM04_9SACH|nr:LADA_0A01134g1_1 [Lachancea dasiensis]
MIRSLCRGRNVGFATPRLSLVRPNRLEFSRSASYQRFNNRQSKSFVQLLVDPASRKYLAFVFGGGSIFYLTHLEEAPVSGRNRFIWLPRYLELKIGSYSYNSMLSQTRGSMLPSNSSLTVKVSTIFEKIVEAARKDPSIDRELLDGVNWQVHIVNDPKAPPNAFVLPGGKVFVFSSILGICKNDDGLATVLSHEFAHQLARHTAENLSKAPIYSILGAVLYTVTGADVFNRLILDSFLKMPASRQMETEADHIGLMIMSRACFKPQEAVELWKRMAEFEKQLKGRGSFSPEFLSTHPASDRRIENMQLWMPQAQELYSQSDCGAMSSYYDSFQGMISGRLTTEGPNSLWG